MFQLRDRVSGALAWIENRALSSYWHARARHVLEGLAIRPDTDLLEIGSGPGLWTSYLAPRVGTMTALELDQEAIRHAQTWRSPRRPVRPVESVRFVEGDAQALPFADDAFDAVLMCDVIEHVPDDTLALREAARVLRPGGRFVLTTVRSDRPSYIRRIRWEHEREYTDQTVRALVAGSGLEIVTTFDFYHAPMMVTREIHVYLENLRPFRSWPARLAISALVSPGLVIERVLPIGRPAGIGIVARKPG